MTAEQKVKHAFKIEAAKRGVMCWDIETTTGRGFPDMYIAYKGQCAWIEFKAITSKVRPEQWVRLHTLANQGIWALTLRSTASGKYELGFPGTSIGHVVWDRAFDTMKELMKHMINEKLQ